MYRIATNNKKFKTKNKIKKKKATKYKSGISTLLYILCVTGRQKISDTI